MINKFKTFLENNIKTVSVFILGAVISGGTVYAATEMFATDIRFNNADTNLSSTTVQGALDEISSLNDNSVMGG